MQLKLWRAEAEPFQWINFVVMSGNLFHFIIACLSYCSYLSKLRSGPVAFINFLTFFWGQIFSDNFVKTLVYNVVQMVHMPMVIFVIGSW